MEVAWTAAPATVAAALAGPYILLPTRSLAGFAVAKSAFALYATFRAVNAGRDVIFDARKGSRALFKAGRAYFLASDYTNLGELNDRSALYVCDSFPPKASKGAFTLVVTSPKKENWSEFVKSPGVRRLVLPVFSETEILALWKLAFSSKAGCSEEDVLERFRKWGGSARNVLTKADDEDWQHSLETAPTALTLSAAENALMRSTALDGVARGENIHRLIKLVPRGTVDGSTLRPDDINYYAFDHAELMSEHIT